MDRHDNKDERGQLERAAQYVRMSTEHQRYSTANQAKAIAEYAESHSLAIVRTYADEGKSGLTFEGRRALQQLVADIVTGDADFSTVLVYDVSRWGRFQDQDESAYYEFICKKAGVGIRYCAESFENDGSLTSTVLKSMKRAMAAEYSRELSRKTFYGTSRIVRLGFHSGGIANYGLRRLLVNPDRTPIAQLEQGQNKALHTDRVILVPGPPEEVSVIRKIFYQFVHEGKTATEIAAKLTADDVPFPTGKSWNYLTIRRILKNEVYIGNSIYNRRSSKMGSTKKVWNPPQEWVRADGAFQPLVSTELFQAAKRLMERRRQHSKDEMLDMLRELLAKKGYLSFRLICETDGMPHGSSYQHRFGSIRRAFELIGYANPAYAKGGGTAEASRAILKSVFAQVGNLIEAAGGTAKGDTRYFFFVVNENTVIKVSTGRCVHFYYRTRPYWRARIGLQNYSPDYAIVARMEKSNRSIKDYYFLPKFELQSDYCLIGATNRSYLEAYRHKSLDFVAEFVANGYTMNDLETDGAVSQRCKRLRLVLEYSQSSSFAKFLEVSPQRWNNVEIGMPLSKDLAMTLTRKIPGLTLDWLYRGLSEGLSPDLAKRLFDASSSKPITRASRRR